MKVGALFLRRKQKQDTNPKQAIIPLKMQESNYFSWTPPKLFFLDPPPKQTKQNMKKTRPSKTSPKITNRNKDNTKT